MEAGHQSGQRDAGDMAEPAWGEKRRERVSALCFDTYDIQIKTIKSITINDVACTYYQRVEAEAHTNASRNITLKEDLGRIERRQQTR